MAHDTMHQLCELLVTEISSSDAFNEAVGNEVDEVLDDRIERAVDKIDIEGQIDSAMNSWESPLEDRVENLETLNDKFESLEESVNDLTKTLEDANDLYEMEHKVDRLNKDYKQLEKELRDILDRLENLENRPSALKVWWDKVLTYLSFAWLIHMFTAR